MYSQLLPIDELSTLPTGTVAGEESPTSAIRDLSSTGLHTAGRNIIRSSIVREMFRLLFRSSKRPCSRRVHHIK